MRFSLSVSNDGIPLLPRSTGAFTSRAPSGSIEASPIWVTPLVHLDGTADRESG
ncbi:hypothetical protein ACTZWT_02405 [Rhodopseudomonas sp. NSM]|uniref:hypothetical protein n=1 Tax=Rhodopseudomonas sp. NSM TaxID=3457630 RepID=UPI004035E5A0